MNSLKDELNTRLLASVQAVARGAQEREEAAREIGARLHQERETSGAGLRVVARSMNISAGHLHDLELGRRHWTPRLIEGFLAALTAAGPVGGSSTMAVESAAPVETGETSQS